MKKHILFQPFFANTKMLDGIYYGCKKYDLQLSIHHPGTPIAHEGAFDGILTNNANYADAIHERGGKAVCCSTLLLENVMSKFDACVACDEHEIGRIGAEHLLRKGHWNFACYLDSLRQQIFVENLTRAGQKSIHCFVSNSINRPGTMAKRIDFLRKLPKPCAFLVQTVHYWEFWNEAVNRIGLRVPEDLAVLCIDDLEYICNLADPPLSSIDTNNFEKGYRACEVLAKLLNQEKVEPLTLIAPQPQVIERASSDYYPVRNEKLRLMIRYAREHIAERLSVSDLAKISSLTMTAVYFLFERHLRTSPKRFLLELQLKRAKYLLMNGNSKMEEVAAESGFASPESFFHFFREYHNITPKEWCCRIR